MSTVRALGSSNNAQPIYARLLRVNAEMAVQAIAEKRWLPLPCDTAQYSCLLAGAF